MSSSSLRFLSAAVTNGGAGRFFSISSTRAAIEPTAFRMASSLSPWASAFGSFTFSVISDTSGLVNKTPAGSPPLSHTPLEPLAFVTIAIWSKRNGTPSIKSGSPFSVVSVVFPAVLSNTTAGEVDISPSRISLIESWSYILAIPQTSSPLI